ncbi:MULTISPECIES: methylmalonyl Co-A mutase-associated GTPase MeaB [Empedobacter]|uniref:Methylmalonyl Co-A mutase-associated GTPase MeaB n=1 Tax=Empedobacter falsenii TaxID=343874 RepID=A0A427BNN2_9FLAO|nr:MULTISPECIES: methylmalonyl Co-A mutase-associated GTPase MeaB [Empedobacter]MBW1618220.1 methylmalonyl Co-A mutase-associated GTPase MeaB [Empedobacter falsenii]MDH0658661.1 methylmalonyl Co-A mutase-associated GTPase MeaB [Empedobacter sp. GD03865]MDH0673478.1 methylmalonyl Co-A mutase-associated GTPase MeaB [Empedobacter sp. GD03861]MDH1603400.1 methylmalonyl Co-A mutase-associated GTPase MeaB [Empedobacter sp. GD03739]MDM1138473.1 methylmalonyl Co-A mutase-associated GTPase MeaB [Empedo
MRKIDPEILAQKIKEGDRFALSRAITLAESNRLDDLKLAQHIISLLPVSKTSKRIAITGIPGVGKSTFIESLGKYILSKGEKVAILAIDPSSSLSKGSILGDKTRMEDLSREENAYIRPSASNGSLGGVTSRTYEAILLCEAAGFENILIETVGVGQSETLVNEISDLFLFLQLPGSGDDLQGIKRGIMEMADLIFVNKSDSFQEKLVKDAKLDIVRSLQFLPTKSSQWKRKSIIGSGLIGKGIPELWELVNDYFNFINENNYYASNREKQQLNQAERYTIDLINQQFLKLLKEHPLELSKNLSAFEMAKDWLNNHTEIDEFLNK